jgi:hypothetical protein
MAYISPEYVKSLQKSHEAKFWKVYDSTGKTLINKLDSDIGLNNSIEALQETLDNCIGDYVTVKLFSIAPTKTQAGAQHDNGLHLKVKLDNSPSNKAAAPYMGIVPGFNEYISLHDKLRELEIEKIKMQLEAESNPSPWQKIGEKLLENDALILAITGLITKAATGRQAQAPAQQQINKPINESNELEETLSRLSAVDPEYKETLAKMTSYLERNPGVIDQIKPIFNQ